MDSTHKEITFLISFFSELIDSDSVNVDNVHFSFKFLYHPFSASTTTLVTMRCVKNADVVAVVDALCARAFTFTLLLLQLN